MTESIFQRIHFAVSIIQLVLIAISIVCGSIYISDAFQGDDDNRRDISMSLLKLSAIPVWTSASLILNAVLGIVGHLKKNLVCIRVKFGFDIYQLVSNITLSLVYGFAIADYIKCRQREFYPTHDQRSRLDFGFSVYCYSNTLPAVNKDYKLMAVILSMTVLQVVLCFMSLVSFCGDCKRNCCCGGGIESTGFAAAKRDEEVVNYHTLEKADNTTI